MLALLFAWVSNVPLPPPTTLRSPATGLEAIAANDNRRPAGRLVQNVLTLALEVREGLLRPEGRDGPGVPALAFAEVGKPPQVPGPLIRVTQGTEIRVSIRNPFPDSTLTVHGLTNRPAAGDTGVKIRGGQTLRIQFRAGTPGTYFYWASTTGGGIARQWFESQLTGALVVDPPQAPRNDRIFVIGAWFRPADSTLAVPRPPGCDGDQREVVAPQRTPVVCGRRLGPMALDQRLLVQRTTLRKHPHPNDQHFAVTLQPGMARRR